MIGGIEGFFYLTERILICPFPGNTKINQNDSEGETKEEQKTSQDESLISEIAEYLNDKHKNQYFVYNLSEHKYDYSFF